jgi:Ca-activated chloride channel family protein
VLVEKFFKQKDETIIFPHLELLKKSSSSISSIVIVSKYLAILFLIISMASPVIKDKIINQDSQGFNISLIIDASGSMAEMGFDATNITKSKFDIVKDIVDDFIEKRENDNISLVVFGDFAYVATPLTYDKEILKSINKTLFVTMAGERTAIYDSIFQSTKLLSSVESTNKVAILLTDGKNSAGVIPDSVAIKMAKKYGIKIYTIGIGRSGDFDKYSLMQISKETNGKFFEANDKNSLEDIYNKIDNMEKSKIKQQSFVKKDYLFQYTLFISIFFMLLFIYFKNRR